MATQTTDYAALTPKQLDEIIAKAQAARTQSHTNLLDNRATSLLNALKAEDIDVAEFLVFIAKSDAALLAKVKSGLNTRAPRAAKGTAPARGPRRDLDSKGEAPQAGQKYKRADGSVWEYAGKGATPKDMLEAIKSKTWAQLQA